MTSDRPTFSESWYRVSELTPRLIGAVDVHRQHFRGARWYVLQDPANNRFFRLSDSAYHFVAMLDGRRSVAQVWRVCMQRFGDEAPTQGEVVDLLGRLSVSNLLHGNLAPDANGLFKRRQKRVWREIKGAFGNLLFIRIPLWDPDRFLNRWVGIFGKVFSRYGLMGWAGILLAGLWSVGSHIDELAHGSSHLLNPENLILLYAAVVIVKLFHEMGHGFACKHLGRRAGAGGEVHQMGVTLLFFTPLPFVDASSSWALRDKWHRMVVAAGGMLAELAIASLAALFWAHSTGGTTAHAIAYNIMFIASISTLAFNGNPFLRYDAYYILSDFLEIPNLESRSKLYLYYLIKRYVWGMRAAFDPSHTKGEQKWLVFYAIASTICRLVIFAAIVLFLMDKYFSIGLLLATILVIRWGLIPPKNLVRYLATSRELTRHRERAVLTTALALCLLFCTVGWVRVPDRFRIEGVIEPRNYAVIRMQTNGFVRKVLDSGTPVWPDGPVLVEASNPELEAKREQLLAERHQLQIERQFALTGEAASVQIVEEKLAAFEEKIARTHLEIDALAPTSPISGVWVAPDIERAVATHVKQGQRIGVVVDLKDIRIRAVASQRVASRLIADAKPDVELRVKGRPDMGFIGRIETIIPAGQERLPSAALGYAAGGSTRIDLQDPSGVLAAEPFFEILVAPVSATTMALRPGQTLVLRFDTSGASLIVQGWRSILQAFQNRFTV